MTDAQIALYASLRVAVPVEWRISMVDHDNLQVVYLTRPVYAEPGPLAPGFARFFRLPNRQVVAVEKLAVAAPLDVIEEAPETHRHLVDEALYQIGIVDPGL